MPASSRILVTFPGKLGDLIYALPALIRLKEFLGGTLHLMTSEYCRRVVPLLERQPCLDACFVDNRYVLDNTRFGCQPWRMSEPDGYDRIFHLGYRPGLLQDTILTRPLLDNFFVTLKSEYGIDLDWNEERPYLFLDNEPCGQASEIIFQGHGATVMDLTDGETQGRLRTFWMSLFDRLDTPVKIVTGAADLDFYRDYPDEIIQPADMLETARLILNAKLFVGVQSVSAAIADGFKTPRLFYARFNNSLPTGPDGLSFSLDANPDEVAAAMRDRYGV